jgi:hypothetical protein
MSAASKPSATQRHKYRAIRCWTPKRQYAQRHPLSGPLATRIPDSAGTSGCKGGYREQSKFSDQSARRRLDLALIEAVFSAYGAAIEWVFCVARRAGLRPPDRDLACLRFRERGGQDDHWTLSATGLKANGAATPAASPTGAGAVCQVPGRERGAAPGMVAK